MKEKLKASNNQELIFEKEVFNVIVKNSKEESTIFFYGNIDFVQPDYEQIKNTLIAVLQANDNIIFKIHSYGGSAVEGIIMYDLIKSFNKKITVVIEGIASDFVLPIAMTGERILMTENSFLNLETIKVLMQGSKEVFESAVNKLEIAQSKLFDIFKEKVNTKYYDDIEKFINTSSGVWLDAKKCKEISLCNEILHPVKKRQFQENETVSALILDPDETINIDVEVSDFLEHKANWTFDKWQNEDPKGLEKLAFRFPQTFSKLFYSKYSEEKMSISKELNNQLNIKNMNNQNNANWTFAEWQEKDPKGLEELSETNPAKFQEIFNKQFKNTNGIENTEDSPKLLNFQTNWTLTDWVKNDNQGLQNLSKSHPNFVKNLPL